MNPKKPSLSKPLALLLGLLILSLGAAAALPDLGSHARAGLTERQQQTLRAAFLKALYDSHKVNTDPLLNQWLTDLGHHLAQFADLPRPPVFLLINSPEINAFAGPGAVIGIHTGLITHAENTDEVAAVIAHELGHVQQAHLLRRFDRAGQDNLASLATLLAALLIGSQNPQAGFATLYAGQGLSLQQQLAFSRAHETEADAVGIRILADAGYNPLAMASFFDKLHQQSRTDSIHIPEILRTHPVSTHRLADALDRATRLKDASYTPALNTDPLPYIKVRINRTPPLTNDPCLNCYATFMRHHKQTTCPSNCQRDNWLIAIPTARQQPHPHDKLKTLARTWPRNVALKLALADTAPSPAAGLKHLADWQTYPPPLRTLMLEKSAGLLQKMGRKDAARLYAAMAARQKGYVKQSEALLHEIDNRQLTPMERLMRQSLETKEKKNHSRHGTSKTLFRH